MHRRVQKAEPSHHVAGRVVSIGRALIVAILVTVATSCGDEQRPTAPDHDGVPSPVAAPNAVAPSVLIDPVPDSIKARSLSGTAASAPSAVSPSLALRGAVVLSSPSADVVQPGQYAPSATAIPFVPTSAPAGKNGPACDDCVMIDVPIGFSFTFFGNSYDKLDISSNGFVRFGVVTNRSASGCCSGGRIPLAENLSLDNMISLAWTDLNPKQPGMIRYETRGTAPNRTFVVQFLNVPESGTTGTVTAELTLYEGSNLAEVHVASQKVTSHFVTQGIENANGTQAAYIPGRVAAVYSLTNDGVRFSTAAPNRAPVASAGGNAGGPPADHYEGTEGSAIAFTATASDADGDALTYQWDFDGDGTVDATGATVSHTYADDGDYVARVTVSDGRGGSVVATVPVHVANVAPQVAAGADVSVAAGQPVALNASFHDPGANDRDWSYTVLWGDDAGGVSSSAGSMSTQAKVTPSHAYKAPGAYRVSVKVKDKDGGEGVSTLTVNVADVNHAPVAVAGGNAGGPPFDRYQGVEGQEVQFDASASHDEDGDALNYIWDFDGDGIADATTAVARHVYADNGSYVATLTVADARGLSSEVRVPVTISNANPTGVFAAPSSVTVGNPIVLSFSSVTDPGSADVATLKLSYDCGSGAGFGASAACPTSAVGTRTVYGRVSDKDGGQSTYGPRTVAIAAAATGTTLDNARAQWGDPVTLRATVTSAASAGAGSPTGTMEFFIDGASVGTAAVTGTGAVTLTLPGARQPGSYAVKAVYSPTAGGNFLGSASSPSTLTVDRESVKTDYTGDLYVLTAGPNVPTASVRLAAALTQDADGYPSNLSLARVRFELYRSTNTTSTPDQVVDDVAVDGSGNAATTLSLASDSWSVKVLVSAANAYWVASPVGSSTLTVATGGTDHQVTGGGWLRDAASPTAKGNFSFEVNSAKSGATKGQARYLFRGADGFDYTVTTTSWAGGGLAFFADPSKASFTGKARVQKTNPATGAVVSTANGYTLTVDIVDGDALAPRGADRLSITIVDASNLVWHQVGGHGTPVVIGGGNVTVHGK